MKLHFRKLGPDTSTQTPLFILHGVFGSSDNWQTVGKVLSENRPVYLIDQRNHGLSPHDDVFDYPSMARDMYDLVNTEGLSKINLLGHSMGGKVAMFFAGKFSELLDSMIVVDIAPRSYPPHHQQIFEGFHAVDPPTLSSRKEAVDRLSSVIKHPSIQQFLLKNLNRENDGSFSWKHNLGVIEENIENIGVALPNDQTFEGRTLFIGGTNSDYIVAEDHIDIIHHFPHASIEMIQGAGHWVHAEKPKELIQMVDVFLRN
jgi:esterase